MDSYHIKGPWRGTLSIIARPRGGDWLEDDLRNWADQGGNAIVSLLEQSEQEDLGLEHEQDFAEKTGVRFLSLPIPDRDVPVSRTATLKVLSKIENLLGSGAHIGIHCRQGIGRSGLIAAALLIMAGSNATEALASIRKARGVEVPETDQQRAWISKFEQEVGASLSRTR